MGAEQSSKQENYNNRTQYANDRSRESNLTTPTVISERRRNPYSFAQSELQNDAGRRNEALYPNLNTNNNSTYGANATIRTSQNASGFVYVRTEEARRYPTQRTVPTCPPPPRANTPSRASTPARTATLASTPTSARISTPPPVPSAPSFPRSASRDRRNGNVYNCPTCNKRFGLEIFGCPNGHSSCKDCRMRGEACGLCGLVITDMRNYAMQDFMAQIKVPCPNANDGCTLQIKTLDMDQHAVECPFAEMACPVNSYRNCRWRGKCSQMQAHFNDVHPEETQGDIGSELILTNICSESHNLYLIPLNPYYFIFHVKVDDMKRCVYMAAQLLGTGMSAAKWTYEVHIYNKREPRRKYMYVAPCTAASLPVNDIFKTAECATLPLPYALTFINEGTLTYKFYIKKGNDNRQTGNDNIDNNQRVYHNRSNFRGNWRGRGRGFHNRSN